MRREFDLIIVGSGIAGLYTALLASEVGRILILTKDSLDECNTKYAQGGIAAPIGPGDSPQVHYEDTIAAGAGLSDPEAVRILTEEATDRVSDLINIGVPFDTQDGEIALTREAAHSMARVLHAAGDATGEQIETTLSRAVRKSSNITVMEQCLVTDISIQDGVCKGVTAFDSRVGMVEEFACNNVILATGGAGRLFKLTTNPDVATGDGVALAYKAGAEVTDMEFFQFHPTALRLPGIPPFLISEAVRGEGGVLRNVEGHRFMPDYTLDAELAPRDIVARSIVSEMEKTNSDHVFLDVTHLPRWTITTRFPSIYRFCLSHGLNITKELIPVAPAAHYMIGGVKTNVWGETNISGLFACGETACTRLHGANRLASNSLMETLVFGKRIIERIKEGASFSPPESSSKQNVLAELAQRETSRTRSTPGRTALQSLMWDKAGIMRDKEGLEEAANVLAAWQNKLEQPIDRTHYELSNSLVTAQLLVEAALIREESRGTHFRTDFPQSLPEWEKHIVFRKGG